MVGAGFSRNADSTEPRASEIPLRQDFAREMLHRLNPQCADTESVEAYDLLRLAQGIKDNAESDLSNLADIDRCDSALGELDSLFVAAPDRLSPRQRPAQRAP